MTVFLSLLVAHLLGDFVLQRQKVVDGKHQGLWSAWFEHATVHLLCLVAAWLLFRPSGPSAAAVGLAFATVVGTHLLADRIKIRYGCGRPLLGFILDQAFHVLVLVAVTVWLIGWPHWYAEAIRPWYPPGPGAALLLAAYLTSVFACGWLNSHVLYSIYPNEHGRDEPPSGLTGAGLRIGWLERFLMLSAFLVEAWAALGLVLAAKSVFRFQDIRKDRAHAEYFLIGTLLSAAEVVVIGALYLVLARTIV